MTHPVIIHMTSRLGDGHHPPEVVEFMTEGTLQTAETGIRLSYNESGDQAPAPCSTVIELEQDGLVSIRRSGGRNGVLLMQQGKRMLSSYDTGYGSVNLCIVANRVQSRFDGSNGTVELAYTMELEGEQLGSNHMTIEVKPAQDAGGRKEVAL